MESKRGTGLSDSWGVRSYLTVGLLFGLTLPGVSAHGFLGGGGRRRGNRVILLYRKTTSAVLRERGSEKVRDKERERERRGERDERVGGEATDAAEDRTVETQTDKEERRRLSLGDADPDS